MFADNDWKSLHNSKIGTHSNAYIQRGMVSDEDKKEKREEE